MKEIVYRQICAHLGMFGYEKDCDGGMQRHKTGCWFTRADLISYKSLDDFIEEYPCYELNPQLN